MLNVENGTEYEKIPITREHIIQNTYLWIKGQYRQYDKNTIQYIADMIKISTLYFVKPAKNISTGFIPGLYSRLGW